MRKTTAPSIHRSLLALAVCALCGCAGNPAAFGTKYPDNRNGDIELLLQRINAAGPRQAGTIAAGITPAPVRLYGYDLAARKLLWQQPVDAASAPFLAGDAAVLQTGDAVAGFDLQTGARRFRVSRGEMSIRGADGENKLVAIALSQGQGTFAKSEVMLLRGGSLLWRRPIDGLVGVPAVVGSVVLVPWSNQFLTAVDVDSGEEIARVRVHDGVVAHAFRDGDQVYIGSFHGITRVTSSIGSGTLRGAGYFSLPEQQLPGRPLLLSDVYTTTTPPPPDSAQHRIALAWRAAPLDRIRIGLQDDSAYLIFYRFVFALSPRDYAVRWVYVNDSDIVGASAQPNGLAFADETGNIAFLGAASGEPAWKTRGTPSSVVRLPPSGAGVNSGGQAPDPNALPARLMTAAEDTDARMVPAHLLAVQELARLPQADATANLIELCDSSRLAPSVRERACIELKRRTIGADHLLTALERHAAYLEGTTSPPVGALAKAAATLKDKRAVGLLIAQLKDPGTRSSDLAPLVAALGDLGDPAAAEPLAGFLRLYHADAGDDHLVRALELVPAALIKLNGPVAQPVLESVVDDELGGFSIRQKARIALDALAAQQVAAEKKDEEQQTADERRLAKEAEGANPAKFAPMTLTTQLVDQTLLPVHDQLQDCLKKQPKPTFQARVLLVVEDGEIQLVSVLPQELQGCIEPLIRSQKFPKTRIAKREQLSYIVKR
jgi:outer membrane protein assembly factor BamB